MRTLRRPLFRGGSTGTGITSGLVPKRGRVDGPGGYAGDPLDTRLSEFYRGDPTIKEVMDVSRAGGYKPRGTNVYDFLTEFGLDIASRPPQGNIFQTAAAAAKEPHQRFLAKKGEAEASQYVSEADMFKTLIKAGATAQGDEGMAGKTEQWKHEMVPQYMNTIATLEAKETLTGEEKIELDAAKFNLRRLETDDQFVTWFLAQPKIGLNLWKDIKSKLLAEDQQSDKPKYDQELGEDDPQLTIDAYVAFKKQVENMGKAEGGRIGYQAGNTVMPGQPMQAQAPGPTDQGSEAPPEIQTIDYETLRARLPNTITDDIVRLIVSSAEAMEDFATIQTQQDISNFNKKYGVELILPAEA